MGAKGSRIDTTSLAETKESQGAVPIQTTHKQCMLTVRDGMARKNWELISPCLTAVIGIVLFHSYYDWLPLRTVVVVLLRSLLTHTGYTAVLIAPTQLLIEKHLLFEIDSLCTALDVVFYVSPFLWREFSCRWNLVRVCVFGAAVFIINVLRLYLAAAMYSMGISVFWSHDIPAYVLWYVTVFLGLLSWLLVERQRNI